MKCHLLLTTLILFCLTVPDCKKGEGPLTPEQATKVRDTIVNYFDCEECDDGELEAVVKMGLTAVPSLAATLLDGPSPANREVMRRNLVTSYRKLKQYEQTHPEVKVPGTEEQYVTRFMDNYVARYQSRAAIGLAAIGGSEARRALEDASRKPLRADVQSTIKASLEKIR